ncbi:protein MMS22-like [Sitophilus oryzae]|uniref:Protein MMS22-like n=1 Tax=Sitophilus oryzae TaxID=7048 RepID=A0A6J2YFN3_SITOR|nr:protein MMS22-like [Sitophilus oryzae]
MSSICLFETCSKNPEELTRHFHYIYTGLTPPELETNTYLLIGLQQYHKIYLLEDITDIISSIRSRWHCIQGVVLNDNIVTIDVLSQREFINEAFKAIIYSLLLCDNGNRDKYVERIIKDLKILFNSIVPVSKLSQPILGKITSSTGGLNCPFYQYLHSFLEMLYYITLLHYLCGVTVENTEVFLESVIKNLSVIVKSTFNRTNYLTTINMCECVKLFTLTVQLIAEKMDVTGSIFWRVFNKVLETEPPLFALYFLKQVSLIQCYNSKFEDIGYKSDRIKPNYTFLEFKIKELLLDTDCDTLACGLNIIEPLLCRLWLKEGKIEIFQIIWDFYSKRLNISNKSSCNISPVHLVEILDSILYAPKDCKEDFEIFLGLLVYHLNEYPVQWTKMRGRIYSQLGPNKVKDLSEIGIRHVALLYLALSSISFEELEKKMLAFLENLPPEKKFSLVVWNIHCAIILKYVRDGRSIEKISPTMVSMLQEASNNQKTFHLIKEFLKNMEAIIQNSSNMNLGQNFLIGSWLGKYQSVCYLADLNKSLDVVLSMLEKCGDADCWPLYENNFKEHVYDNLKQLSTTHNPPGIIGKIAAKVALLNPSLTTDSFNFFSTETVPPKICSNFLEIILDSYPDHFILTPLQENQIVQSWARICFLSAVPQIELSKRVLKLDVFPAEMKCHLNNAQDPMEAFINYLGSHSKQSYEQTSELLTLCGFALNNLDKLLAQYVQKPESEDITLNIYRYASLTFLNCSNLIYNRNKPVTILTKLVEVLLLPMDFMTGKKIPHPFVLNGIKHTWTVFFKAFINISSNNDPYIDRLLKDMVVKYMPYFATSDSPIVNSLKEPDCATVILEKLYLAYFKPSTKESDANVIKALKIIADLINNNDLSLLRVMVKKVLPGLFEVVIFHSQRSVALGVIKNLTSSPLFLHVREVFKQAILAISDKNVGLNTINYFQLVTTLAKFAPGEVKEIIESIKIQVVNVERLRGVGFDKTLRTHLERLENVLKNNT